VLSSVRYARGGFALKLHLSCAINQNPTYNLNYNVQPSIFISPLRRQHAGGCKIQLYLVIPFFAVFNCFRFRYVSCTTLSATVYFELIHTLIVAYNLYVCLYMMTDGLEKHEYHILLREI